MIKKKDLSAEDKKVWEDYTNSPSNIYDKENQNSSYNLRKKRFKFDLHGFTLDEANQKVKEIIFACIKKNYEEILFITGKGLHSNIDNNIYVSKDLSILKYSVPEFIENNSLLNKMIIEITDAKIEDGGSGAFYIYLKNKFKSKNIKE